MLVRPGIGVRRPVLQQRMMERAAALGATFLWGTPVSGLCRAGVALAGGAMVRARWIIGADGSGSVGAGSTRTFTKAAGSRFGAIIA